MILPEFTYLFTLHDSLFPIHYSLFTIQKGGDQTDWEELKREYLAGGVTYAELARKWGLPESRLRRRAREERWQDLRRQARSPRQQRQQRMIQVTDRLLDRLEQAVEELEKQTVVRKTRQVHDGVTITQEYREPVEVGMVDREGLRQIVAALKEVRSLQSLEDSDDGGLQVILGPGLEEFAQ